MKPSRKTIETQMWGITKLHELGTPHTYHELAGIIQLYPDDNRPSYSWDVHHRDGTFKHTESRALFDISNPSIDLSVSVQLGFIRDSKQRRGFSKKVQTPDGEVTTWNSLAIAWEPVPPHEFTRQPWPIYDDNECEKLPIRFYPKKIYTELDNELP